MFYVSLTVNTKKKPNVDTEKIKRRKSRQNKDFFITSPPRMLYPAKLSSRCEGENTDYPKQISLGSSSVLDLPYKM